jgi:hypothetical protein
MSTPEEEARERIDPLLDAAGWRVQDRNELNLGAALGVAVREFPLTTGFADYLLFVKRRLISIVEAKAVGTPLSGVELQSEKYSAGLPGSLSPWYRPLPFLYESTGVETFFTHTRDPEPRSRRVFAFHKPRTLAEWAACGGRGDLAPTDVTRPLAPDAALDHRRAVGCAGRGHPEARLRGQAGASGPGRRTGVGAIGAHPGAAVGTQASQQKTAPDAIVNAIGTP